MEPFSLFQFLQSFLGQNPENAPQAQAPAGIDDESRATETAPTANTEQKNALETEWEADSTNHAILSFMQAHDSRAKRIKKL